MRDFASCFSEHAVKVSDKTTCSGGSSNSNSNSSSSSTGRKSSVVTSTAAAVDQSVQTAISSLYRTRLTATHKDVLTKITWSQSPHTGTVLSVGVDVNDHPNPRSHRRQWDPNSISSHILRKVKGSQSFLSGRSVVLLYWNYYSVAAAAAAMANSKMNSGPELPVTKLFYVIVLVDAVPALSLGDLSGEFMKKQLNRSSAGPVAADTDFSILVGRREQVVWKSSYSTRARFGDGGGSKDHDIVIRTCKGDAELVVVVDKKEVVHVRRLQWNFRGNQTIFLDGLAVDMMWDVGNWWFGSPPGGSHAVFLFRRRSALQSRLWLDEEEEEVVEERERGISGFSLLIQAFKNP
ncbi:Uncharacterized protein M6B38_249055 [Iris pallida]|uniref:Uncharacterized protein n=1 Tax=Iris pallida TaxID=29817 RepID=A0AAX6DFI5_IRIPA|nr:Uncharacterized protein M6B38_249055 [Iris pallida]